MASKARGNHTAPGIYQKEIDFSYSVQSLGITSLALAGETLQGPAFEPIEIEDWTTFKQYFGSTSPEKFAGSQYPKYELPYIAKSYLTESQRLTVCRVLGLSGYNAGPAWFICAVDAEGNKQLVAVLRSRGYYTKFARIEAEDECHNPIYKYDEITYLADEVTISPAISLYTQLNCDVISGSTQAESFAIDRNNYGQFTLNAYKNGRPVGSYGVSLNPGTKNYILDVLGGKQENGDAALFVEELYDAALIQGIEDESKPLVSIYFDEDNAVSGSSEYILYKEDSPIIAGKLVAGKPVIDFIVMPEDMLSHKQIGQRYLAINTDFTCHDMSGASSGATEIGCIYTVKQFVKNGKKVYYYVNVDGEKIEEMNAEVSANTYVYVNNEDSYFTMEDGKVVRVAIDMNDYKEQFRCASTPWIVSELKGDGQSIDIKKLFRFHTISDGNNANAQVKISIQNIRPDEGLFDVVIRDFADSDGNLTILERYTKCSMVPGTANYIGYKIGTTNGDYEIKSKYVTVEVIENEVTAACVPAGFLGYPIRSYNDDINAPVLNYNCNYEDDIKTRKQYFGLSDLVGVDVDVFTYKGVAAYKHGAPLTNGFHLDSNINPEINPNQKVTVDGEEGYVFSTVSPLAVTDQYANPTLVGTEEEMADTIFADVNLRKFTVYPCGGFDGWDIYRDQRTNTDEFKANKYKGSIVNGVSRNFSKIKDGDIFDLSGNCITTDYYAYLAAYRQFSNKEAYDVNLFATPGIDYVNNKLLVADVIDMIEDDEKRDMLYVVTTPDKPAGYSDSEFDMYSAEEVMANLEDSDIDSSYVTTYYPWVKYLDTDNDSYIYLPATKDAVRNFAATDNTAFPWYATAGINRGSVSCINVHKALKMAEQDVVYGENDGYGINPIVKFAQDGIKMWGNKTLYDHDTPLNRVNNRRLMLRIEKLVYNGVKGLLFDPNDNTVASQFTSIVSNILKNVKDNRGITDYKITVDTSAEARDRHELPATIKVKPINALEYIDITYHITPEGVSLTEE